MINNGYPEEIPSDESTVEMRSKILCKMFNGKPSRKTFPDVTFMH
jgi:hypothetical protein